MLITFEGLDFSGKTTQANLLLATLRGRGEVVHFIREPGGTPISERVRELLLDRSFPEMDHTAELFLFSASRIQLVSEVILPALRRNEVVLCDRYHDSTTAYQGYGRGVSLEAIRGINRLATSGVDPDLTLLIDIPVEEIERRKTAAGLTFDRMESGGRAFYERVREGYLALARTEQHRIVCLDGRAPVEEIAQRIRQHVEPRLTHRVPRV
jgi:dTMP kinase